MPSSWSVPLPQRSRAARLNDASRHSTPLSPPPEKSWNLQRGHGTSREMRSLQRGILQGALQNLQGRTAGAPDGMRSLQGARSLQGSAGVSRCWVAKHPITAAYSGRSRTRFQNQPLWSPRDGNRTRATWDFSNRGNRSGQFWLRERNQSDAFWNLRHPAAEMQAISGQSQNDFHQWGPRAGRLPTIRRFPATPKRSVAH